ncbi:hypothetical protein FUA23_14540 [Neolewinella aurantiaca]|uniref:Uncharacterized protein n=1 Tax=Neolewinella aurantiaca TaxID=2602767 RepID=A0A5C7FT11_9BACT|nr:hypothetical protein [Neolewinella aurantiaca]TXF88501.1 hypothetical protein FUA23_14540 [Neolewinella aurantiaca]
MSTPPEIKNKPKLKENDQYAGPGAEERDRLRDIIIVFVTYPLTPTERTSELADKKPWLEFLSLLLKVSLAAYALYEGVTG